MELVRRGRRILLAMGRCSREGLFHEMEEMPEMEGHEDRGQETKRIRKETQLLIIEHSKDEDKSWVDNEKSIIYL